MRYSNTITNSTPQSEPVIGREAEMEQNRAGGYMFRTDDFTRLRRFLILGTDSNAYYASARELTVENLGALHRCMNENGEQTVEMIVDVSRNRLASSNDHALLALAYVSVKGDVNARRAAYEALPQVARIGTHLFSFLEYRKMLGGGWGRGTRNAIASWYNDRDVEALEYQMLKYRQRNGWTHADALRLAHPVPASEGHDTLFAWATGNADNVDEFAQIAAYEALKNEDMPVDRVVNLVRNLRLPREALPTKYLNEPEVWEALLVDMPINALVRSLAKLTSLGVVAPFNEATNLVREKLTNAEAIKYSGIHPINLLSAMVTYGSGFGFRGNLRWTPVPKIIGALDEAFYMAFKNVEPTGKRTLIGIDGSGSMLSPVNSQLSMITASQAAAAMAMATARGEEDFLFTRFDTQAYPVDITANMRLDDVMSRFSTGHSTDCSSTIRWAIDNEVDVDAIVIYSDLMSWYGREHPFEAMQRYRKVINSDTRLVYAAFVAYGGQLDDPVDPLSLNVVGLDSSVPSLIRGFVAGDF